MISSSRCPAVIIIVLPVHLCSSFHALLGLGNPTKSPECTMLQKEITFSIGKFWFMRASHFMVLPAMALNFCLNLGLAVTLMPSVMSSTQWLTSASLFSLVPHYQACQGRTVNCCLPQSCTSLSAFREILKFLRYNLGKCFLLEAFPDSPSLNYPFSHILEKHSTLFSLWDLPHLFTWLKSTNTLKVYWGQQICFSYQELSPIITTASCSELHWSTSVE